jgi:hypothetical protein
MSSGPKSDRACGGVRVECLRQNRITIWFSRGKQAIRTRRQYAWPETPAAVAAVLRARLTRRRIPFLRPNRVGRALTLGGLPGLWRRAWWYPYFECPETRFKVRRGKTFVKRARRASKLSRSPNARINRYLAREFRGEPPYFIAINQLLIAYIKNHS